MEDLVTNKTFFGFGFLYGGTAGVLRGFIELGICSLYLVYFLGISVAEDYLVLKTILFDYYHYTLCSLCELDLESIDQLVWPLVSAAAAYARVAKSDWGLRLVVVLNPAPQQTRPYMHTVQCCGHTGAGPAGWRVDWCCIAAAHHLSGVWVFSSSGAGGHQCAR